jgi:hypothetical protein
LNVDLNIAFRGNSLQDVGQPTGGNIQVHFAGEQRPQMVIFTVEDGSGWAWKSQGKIGDWGVAGKHDVRSYIGFYASSPEGRRLLDSMASGKSLRVKVEADGQAYAQAMFDRAPPIVPAKLLARLRKLADAGPPPGCQVGTGPIVIPPVHH